LGDKQEAFKWLEDAYKAHDVGLIYLKIDPCLDPLRSDRASTTLSGASGSPNRCVVSNAPITANCIWHRLPAGALSMLH